ncbi:hypothetical protein AB0M43_17375 [Longispora sp. NPDC051575]|uniref:hypothetical protein n=1 Tax=Longispora sp. NPDC051575 TaxID=3154943 RepID=UPI0034176497
MRDDLRVDWRVPPDTGWLDRFMGPGKSRAESLVEYVGGACCVALLAAYCWRTADGLSSLQLTVIGVLALDLVGGVLTNATNAAKRWYHRTPSPRGRLTFVAAHVLHLAAVAFLVLPDGAAWFVVNTLLLLGAAVLIERVAPHLRRPVAMSAYMVAVLVNLLAFPVPAVLAWFAAFFFLKLLVCHLVPEAPLVA